MAILKVKGANGNWQEIPAIVGSPGKDGDNAEVVKVTLPKGRMKGDMDGDGEVTMEDAAFAQQAYTQNIELDEVQTWCIDANGDGKLAILDAALIRNYALGNGGVLTKTPTMADYYGNWTYVKVDDLTGYFYTDIAVEGLTAACSAIVAVQGDHKRDAFAGAECMDGCIRVKANILPVADATCLVFFADGDGTAVVVPENVIERVGVPTSLKIGSATSGSYKIFSLTITDTGVITATDTDGVAYTFTGTAVTA